MTLTVFTATYNRKYLLEDLYNSLVSQQFKDFEWLVIDDGSTDTTKPFMELCKRENKIAINYFYKENGGKHTAINYGVSKAKGDLMFFVDSDDILTENALQLLADEWETIKNNKSINGIVGLFQDEKGVLLGDTFDESIKEVPFAAIYYKHNLKGDKAVAFKTEILKKYPFPEKEGITFVFEAVVWHAMSKKYKTKCINTPIQIVSYQPSGLSDSNYKRWYLKGLAFSYFNLVNKNVHPLFTYPSVFFQNYMYLAINSMLSNQNYFSKLKVYQKIIYVLVFPRALWAYYKMKKLIVK